MTVPPDAQLIADVRAAMRAAGDPERAVAQQAYMKSAMPFHGIGSPELKALLRPFLRAYDPDGRARHEGTVRVLWDEATHREERYAATALARHRKAKPWLDAQALGLYRHLVVTGAWWDHVDEIASHLIGGVLAGHRTDATPTIRVWASDEDLWVRRSAVLCQLRHKADTDLDLLRYAIEQNVEDRSFWLRKAIGWALREYARTDPAWVRQEVDSLGSRMSGLSRREALKHLV